MKRKALLLLSALVVAAVAMAGTPSCEIWLPRPTQAGSLLLEPGQYRIWVRGANAVFTNVVSHHTFVARVKVESTGPHEVTTVDVGRQGELRVLKSIELAGTDETLQFE